MMIKSENNNLCNRSITMSRKFSKSAQSLNFIRGTTNDKERFNNIKLSFANNIDVLTFKYTGGHSQVLYNYQLKIKNQSKEKIAIKIKSNSPSHFEVRPAYSTLDYNRILSVSIQLKLNEQDISPISLKHDLSRYKNDKLKVVYIVAQRRPDTHYQEKERVFSIEIEQSQDQKFKNETSLLKVPGNQNQLLAAEEKEILIYEQLQNKNKQNIKEIDQKIKLIQNQKGYEKYFNSTLFIAIILMGFFLGFWVG